LLPPTSDPAACCAGVLVERLDLTPPVNVMEVAGRYADLEILSWEFACDALVVGLGSMDGRRPKVFIRANYQGRRRRRFTIAHEIGHLVLPWTSG